MPDLRLLGLSLGLGLALTACGGGGDDVPLTPQSDAAAYESASAAASAALVSDLGLQVDDSDTDAGVYAGHGDLDGTCVYTGRLYRFDSAFGKDVAWDDVRSTVGTALGSDYVLGDQHAVTGGYLGFDAVAASGARVEVLSKDTATLQVLVPVDGSCS